MSVRPLYHRQPKKKPSMVEGSEADGDETLCAHEVRSIVLLFCPMGRTAVRPYTRVLIGDRMRSRDDVSHG